MNCNNCKSEVQQNYCSNCGHAVSLPRINGPYILGEIQRVLNLEKGILFTIRELLLRPGANVRHFIAENRSRLVKPILFIIVTSLLYSIVNSIFHIEEGYVDYGGLNASATGVILKWIQDHYGYSNLIMGVFIAFWTKIMFRKYGYNFYEILILLCFVMGMGMLLLAIFALVEGLAGFNFMQIAGITFVVYASWAIGQFFDKKKPMNYVRAFAAYILGMITFTLSAVLLGTVIDMVVKT